MYTALGLVAYKKYSGSCEKGKGWGRESQMMGWARTVPPGLCIAWWLGPSLSFSGAAWKTLKYITSPGLTSKMLAEFPHR